jgi:hypothetical protein
MTGIQAMELYNYSRSSRRGECMAVEAAKELDKLVHGKVFRLVSMHMRSGAGDRGRIRSSLQVKQGGRWIDPAMVLLKKGLVLWDPDGEEWAWNGVYSRLAEQAAARGVGLWNPVACGKPGPSQDSPLSMKVKWDANGSDGKNVNGEWVRIRNADPVNAVPLGGWLLRDSATRAKNDGAYKFPANAVVPAGGSVMVRVGGGPSGNGIFHWGLTNPKFQNAGRGKRQPGDGAYLFDPNLEMRAHVQYPCRVQCAEPLRGKVAVFAHYRGSDEWIKVKNVSGQPVNLDQYEIENAPWFFEFGRGTVLQPHRALILFVDEPGRVKTRDGRTVKATPGVPPFGDVSFFRSWGSSALILADKGDVVTLRNPLGAPVTCFSWGRKTCPRV